MCVCVCVCVCVLLLAVKAEYPAFINLKRDMASLLCWCDCCRNVTHTDRTAVFLAPLALC
jgi:hypothetical protein